MTAQPRPNYRTKRIRDSLHSAIAFLEEEFPVRGEVNETSVTAEAQRLVSELTVALDDLREVTQPLAIVGRGP